jgi:hypothetical protein
LKGLEGRGGCVKGKANKCYARVARVVERESNGRRQPAWFIYFFSFLNRTGSVRFGLAGLGTPKPETEPDIFLNILTGSIGFFTGLVFSVNFFLVFWFFSHLY